MLPNNIQFRSGAQLVTCAESNRLAAADMRGNWLLKCSSHTLQLAHLHLLLIHSLSNQHRLQPLPEISLTFLLEVAQAFEFWGFKVYKDKAFIQELRLLACS